MKIPRIVIQIRKFTESKVSQNNEKYFISDDMQRGVQGASAPC
jgi:hypothetical protein